VFEEKKRAQESREPFYTHFFLASIAFPVDDENFLRRGASIAYCIRLDQNKNKKEGRLVAK
jgi:hypothetical protein